jgi:hypothetical protein
LDRARSSSPSEIGRRTSFAMTCPTKKVFASDPDHPDHPDRLRYEHVFARPFGGAQTLRILALSRDFVFEKLLWHVCGGAETSPDLGVNHGQIL